MTHRSTGRPVPGGGSPDSHSRQALHALWHRHRSAGHGAVIAAFADAARQGHVDWRRPGQSTDPQAHAEQRFGEALRLGWMIAA